MRKLNVEDSFAFSEILDKSGIDADLNDMTDKAQAIAKKDGFAAGQSFLGGQLAFLVVKKAHKVKEELITFLASIYEVTPDEYRKMGLKALVDALTSVFNDPEFKSFFPSLEPSEPKSKI